MLSQGLHVLMHATLRLLALTLVCAATEILADDGLPLLDRRLLWRALVNLFIVAASGVAWLRNHA